MVCVRVRNYNESSDLGLLLLSDKPKKEKDDWDNYAWPFVEKGQGPDIKEIVCDRTHTKDTWFNGGPIPCSFFMWRKTRRFLYESYGTRLLDDKLIRYKGKESFCIVQGIRQLF